MRFDPDRCAHCGGPPLPVHSECGLSIEGRMSKHDNFFFCSDECLSLEVNRYLPPDLVIGDRGKALGDDPEFKQIQKEHESWRKRLWPEGRLYSQEELAQRDQHNRAHEAALDRFADAWMSRRRDAINAAVKRIAQTWHSHQAQVRISEAKKLSERLQIESARLAAQRERDEKREQLQRERDEARLQRERDRDRAKLEAERLKEEEKLEAELQAKQEFEELILPRPVPQRFRFEHTHILGPQGSGKTTLLQQIFLDDLDAEDTPGYIVIDPKGFMIERLSKVAHPKLQDRLVIIDPANAPALNMFRQKWHGTPVQASAIRNQLIDLFAYVFSTSGAALTQRQSVPFGFVLRLVFFLNGDINTLLDILEDKHTTRSFWPQIEKFCATDPSGASTRFFTQDFYSTDFAGTKQQIRTRMFEIVGRPELAAMFLAADNKLDLFDCIQRRKIVLVNTGMSHLGASGSQLLGRYIIAMAMNAAFTRYYFREEWPPTWLMIDEFQDFVDEDNTPKLLRLSREYRMGVIMAHQTMFAPELNDAIRNSISSSAVKYAASPEGMDLGYMTRDLRCEKDFLIKQQVDDENVNFACYVRGMGLSHPFQVAVPRGNIENYPRLSDGQYAALMNANNRMLASARRPEPPVSPPSPPVETLYPQEAPKAVRPPPQDADHTQPATEWGQK